jgi:cytochrome c1
MYIHQNDMENNLASIFCDINKHSIPLDPANSDYQRVLDDIIEQGADCFEGDIPTDLQDAADAKQFAQQVEAYKIAKARVAQYQLSVGVPESSETIVTGQEMNMETGEMQDVTETIVTPAIPALEATVEVTTYDMETDTSSTETVANPLIVKDDEERAAAQAVINATPGPVKAHVDS